MVPIRPPPPPRIPTFFDFARHTPLDTPATVVGFLWRYSPASLSRVSLGIPQQSQEFLMPPAGTGFSHQTPRHSSREGVGSTVVSSSPVMVSLRSAPFWILTPQHFLPTYGRLAETRGCGSPPAAPRALDRRCPFSGCFTSLLSSCALPRVSSPPGHAG